MRDMEEVIAAAGKTMTDPEIAEALCGLMAKNWKPNNMEQLAYDAIRAFLSENCGYCFDSNSIKDIAVQELIVKLTAKMAGWESKHS